MKHLPRILLEQPAPAVGQCILSLSTPPGAFPARTLLKVAGEVERANEPGLALRLYECAWQSAGMTPADEESILFRVGMLCESWFQNFERAMASYQEIVNRYPMSPMADQARARLKVMAAKVAAKTQ